MLGSSAGPSGSELGIDEDDELDDELLELELPSLFVHPVVDTPIIATAIIIAKILFILASLNTVSPYIRSGFSSI